MNYIFFTFHSTGSNLLHEIKNNPVFSVEIGQARPVKESQISKGHLMNMTRMVSNLGAMGLV